jgi:hypothetical protein
MVQGDQIRQKYSSALTDEQWAIVEPLIPPPEADIKATNGFAMSRGGYSPCSPYSLLCRCVRLCVAPFPLRALDMRCAHRSSESVGSGGMSDTPVSPGECKKHYSQGHLREIFRTSSRPVETARW